MFTAKGGTWQQTAIAGHTANTLAKLRADVIAGNAPPAVQLKGPEIAEWNDTGMTANLDELADAEGWEKVVAPELLPVMKPTGNWVAAPMNIHRINWLWASPKVMEEAGVTELPKTWAEFNAACDKIVAAGKICISHSTADWTDSTVFEVVVYGKDLDLYKKAFVEGDVEAMRSDGMVKAFEQFRTMTTKYMDPGMVGRDWDTMSHLVGTRRGRLPHHGRLDDRPADGRRLQGRHRLCLRPGADRLGQAGLHPQLRLGRVLQAERPGLRRRPEAARQHRSCRPSSRPSSTRPRARSRPGSTSTSRTASIPASSSRRRTCRPRSRAARWSARWRTT